MLVGVGVGVTLGGSGVFVMVYVGLRKGVNVWLGVHEGVRVMVAVKVAVMGPVLVGRAVRVSAKSVPVRSTVGVAVSWPCIHLLPCRTAIPRQ